MGLVFLTNNVLLASVVPVSPATRVADARVATMVATVLSLPAPLT